MTKFAELSSGSEDPLYNIGVVTRMTNISTATLRAWERRYNFPQAQRTSGGHRLYSERDILRLQWVKKRVDEGMQTAQAINALKYQEETGHVLLLSETKPTIKAQAIDQPAFPVFRDRLLTALFDLNIGLSDQILSEASAVFSPEDLILEVITPTLAKFGDAWEEDEISIANEHLATNYLRQRLLMWMLSGPPPKPVQPIILACAPNEWHEGSLLVLGALLRRRRWPIAYLGQAVPLPDLANFVRSIKPSAIVLVAMMVETASQLAEWSKWLPEVATSGIPPVGYGGRVFTLSQEWQMRTPGIYLGSDFREAIENLERIII